jgi:hypothetical protein
MQETVYDRCSSHHLYSSWIKQNATASSHGTSVKSNYELLFCPCMQAIIKSLQDLCSMNKLCVHGKGYIVSRLHRLHTTASCAASTHHPAARALPQPCRAPRLLVTRVHGLYINLFVRREYSSPGRSGSTSTKPYAAATSSSGRTTTSTSLNNN